MFMRISKKFAALAVALCLALALLPGAALAAVTGAGTDADPYIVTTAAELSEAVSKGGVIKVTQDITDATVLNISSTTVTITGDNKTITAQSGVVDLFVVSSGGKLTLGAGLTVESSSAILYANGGEIIVDGAAVNGTGSAYATAFADNGGKIVVQKGSVTSSGNSALGAGPTGSVTVAGGTVSSDASNVNKSALYSTGGTVTVIGGTISAPYSASTTITASYGGILTIAGGTVVANVHGALDSVDNATIKVQDDANIQGKITDEGMGTATVTITGGTFTEDPAKAANATVDSAAPAAAVTSGGATTYAVGANNIQKAAAGGGTVDVTQGSVDLTGLPAGTTVTNSGGGAVSANGRAVANGESYTVPTPPAPGSGYSGPDVRYVGGNTFESTTSQAPREVRIDGQPVAFTGDGSRFTVSCIQPGASSVTVSWGNSTYSTNFRPDAAAYCGQTSIDIPKTGGASVTAYAIAALAAAAGLLRRKR